MSPRSYLESQVIGGALFSPSFALEVLDILSDASFKDEDNRKIYRCLTQLATSGNLTLPEIHLHWMKESTSAHVLTQRLHEFTGSPVMPLAMKLLELDMREKFTELLSSMEREKSKAEAFELAGALKQTRDYLSHPAHDLFESIDRVGDYLRSYLSLEDLEPWNALTAAIPKLVSRIKNRSKTQLFLSQLMSLPAAADSHSQKISLEIIAQIATDLLSRKEIPQVAINRLYDLKTNLWKTPTESSPLPSF
jgi:hypothetical protein